MAARRRKLLLADDSLTIQKVVSLTFSDEGIEVVTASDGRQALLLLEESPPDIVLADTYMPGPNGYHLCEHVKGDPRLRHIPVVLLVGTFEPFNEAEARRVGADMVLTKPFQSIKELVSKVGSLFGGGRADDAEDEPTTRNLTPPPAAREDARRAAAAPAQPWQEPRVTEAAAPVSEHASAPPVADSAAEVSFGQLELDDPMIEAREVEPVSLWDETGTRQPDWHGGADAHQQSTHAPAPAAYQEPDTGFNETQQSRETDMSLDADAGFETNADLETDAGFETHVGLETGTDFDTDAREETHARPSLSEAPAEASFAELSAEPSFAGASAESFASHPPAREESHATPRAAATADDALLDLDDMDAPAARTSAASVGGDDDDFILDLGLDDEPAPQSSASAGLLDAPAPEGSYAAESSRASAPETFESNASETYVAAAQEQPAAAQSSLAEAAHGEREAAPEQSGGAGYEQTFYFGDGSDETPTVIAPAPQIVWEDARESGGDAHRAGATSPEASAPESAPAGTSEAEETTQVVEAPAFGQSAENIAHGSAFVSQDATRVSQDAAHAPAAEPSAAPRAGQLTLADVSPEVIDAIARRVVERMSDGVVREIAWEVVPELSELLIKQRLDEERSRTS